MTEEQLIDAYNPAWANKIPGEPDEVYAVYRTRVRRDMSRVLAVVREHIALELEAESECTPCSEDALVVRGCADLVRASGSYDRVDEIISARQHDVAALAEANASLALVSGNRDALAEDLADTQAALAEALRRCEKWRKKAEHYNVLAAAVRERARQEGPSLGRLLANAAYADAARELAEARERIAALEEGPQVDDAMVERAARLEERLTGALRRMDAIVRFFPSPGATRQTMTGAMQVMRDARALLAALTPTSSEGGEC